MAASTSGEGERTIVFRFTGVESARRMQNSRDEALGVIRHYMDVPVNQLQRGLAELSEPNPRPRPSTNKKVARQIEQSLLNLDVPMEDVFHLAHLGITVIGDVARIDDNTYEVTFTVDEGNSDEPSDGIVNGLHSLAVIEKVLKEAQISDEQYVTFNIISGIPQRYRDALIPWIARGRNTVLQVKDQSIDNLMGLFQPFKDALADLPYANKIGWEESARTQYDVMDVMAILTALNPVPHPNQSGGPGDEITHPVIAYEKQSACLKLFENPKFRGSYEGMISLLPDALHLFDLIRSDAVHVYNSGSRSGGNLRIVEKKTGRDGKATPNAFEFPFYRNPDGSYGRRETYRLSAGATYATLAAFRVFVIPNATGKTMRWDGGFKAALQAWKDLGEELMVSCAETSQSLGGPNNLNATGKHRPLWRGLHKTVRGYAAELENQRLRKQLDEAKKAVA